MGCFKDKAKQLGMIIYAKDENWPTSTSSVTVNSVA